MSWYPPSPTLVLPFRAYGRRIGVLPDDLLDLQPSTEEDVIRANGALNTLGVPTWSIAEGAGQPSLYKAAGLTWVRLGTVSQCSALTLPLDGVMAVDEWTLQMFIRPRGADLATIAPNLGSGHFLLYIGDGGQFAQYLSITVYPGTPPAYQIYADLFYYDFVAAAKLNWGSNVALTTGDFPADTPGSICLSFDATNGLILTVGAASKQANDNSNSGTAPTASRIAPWSGDVFSGGGIWLAQGGNQYDDGIDRTIPVLARYSNAANLYGPDAGASAGSGTSPGAYWRYRPRPKLTLNAAASGSTYQKHIGGILLQGITNTNYAAGNQFKAIAAAGCPLIRVAAVDDTQTYEFNYATMSSGGLTTLTGSTAVQRATGGAGSIGGTAIGINWATFDAPVLAMYNAGIDVHAMIGYIPTALQVGGNPQVMPSSTANYALWASAIYGRYVWLGTQATGAGRLVDCTFWNEAQGEWQDTMANFVILYMASQQQIHSDQAANGNSGAWLGTDDGIAPGANPSSPGLTYLSALLAAANSATPRPALTSVCYHDYVGANLTLLHQDAQVMEALGAANGYSGLTPRNTEYDMAGGIQSSFPSHVGTQAGVERTSDVYQAAATYAGIVEMLARGFDMACFFTAETIFAGGIGGGGQYGSLFDSGSSTANIYGDGLQDGKPTMVFQMFAMLWKHHFGLTSVQLRELWSGISSPAPWPNLRGILTTGTNGAGKTVVTATYGSFRHVGGQPSPKCRVDFEWTLPGGFTVASWKQWGISDNLRGVGRLPLRAQDQSSNAAATLPIQDLIDWESVHCIQVTGS